MKRVWLFLISLFFISFISATTTTLTANPISFNIQPGASGTISVSYSIIENIGNAGSNGVSLTGTPRFITYSGGSISYGANITTNGTLTINYLIPSNATGTIVNSVVVDGNVLELTFNVQVPQTQYNILVFPTNKIISVVQGEEKTQNIVVTVPSSYPRPITIQSVDFNPQVSPIRFSDLNLGLVSPGQTVNIPIIFSGIGASVGTYQTQLSFFVIDSQGQVNMPPVNLQVQVSAGINPISNFSLTDLPSCSLNMVELNLNTTASLTCSRNNPNIEIQPVIDDFYLQGVSVQTTSTQYIYNFKALKIGNTIFKANYLYQNGPVGIPFNQTLRITNSGNNPVPGTTFAFALYQDGIQKEISQLHEGDIILQLKDNTTGNIINDYKIYLGGVQINNSINAKSGVTYQMTATAPGYNDNSLNFNITSIPSIITITPTQQSYIIGQTVNITTDSNATLYIDGVQITSPYLFTTTGVRVLKASKEGYIDTLMNLTVNGIVTINIISPEFKDWGKGNDITMKLSSSGIWNVTFEKLNDANSYDVPTSIATGVGDSPAFKITDYGKYNIYLDNQVVGNYTFQKKGIGEWLKNNWLWGIVGVILIFLGWFLFFRSGGGSNEGDTTSVGY